MLREELPILEATGERTRGRTPKAALLGPLDALAESILAFAGLAGADRLIWPRTRLAAEVGRAVRRALKAPT